MFGLLAGAVLEIARGISGIGCTIENAKGKQRGREREANGQNPSHTYYDRKGVERDLITNEIRRTSRQDGDKVLTNKYGEVVRNFSQEEREANLAIAKMFPKPYVTVIPWGDAPHKAECKGKRYKDIETGDIYVVREIPVTGSITQKYGYYMNATTGDYVRPCDYEMYRIDKGVRTLDEVRACLEEYLKRKKTHFDDDVWKYDNCYAAWDTSVSECSSTVTNKVLF